MSSVVPVVCISNADASFLTIAVCSVAVAVAPSARCPVPRWSMPSLVNGPENDQQPKRAIN